MIIADVMVIIAIILLLHFPLSSIFLRFLCIEFRKVDSDYCGLLVRVAEAYVWGGAIMLRLGPVYTFQPQILALDRSWRSAGGGKRAP